MSESMLNNLLIPLSLKPINKNGRRIMHVLCLLKDNWIKNSTRLNIKIVKNPSGGEGNKGDFKGSTI